MESVIIQINAIRQFLKTRKKITIGKTRVGSWIVADDFNEICALVVVKFMLDNNYKFVGDLVLIVCGENNDQYVLTLK